VLAGRSLTLFWVFIPSPLRGEGVRVRGAERELSQLAARRQSLWRGIDFNASLAGHPLRIGTIRAPGRRSAAAVQNKSRIAMATHFATPLWTRPAVSRFYFVTGCGGTPSLANGISSSEWMRLPAGSIIVAVMKTSNSLS
jgi:hypothetical protein